MALSLLSTSSRSRSFPAHSAGVPALAGAGLLSAPGSSLAPGSIALGAPARQRHAGAFAVGSPRSGRGEAARVWGCPPLPLALAAVLVALAVLVAPEQPRDQEAICHRHAGVEACRVW
jgi:hypothetical protein